MPRKSNRNYFTQETEDAIIRYNNTDDFNLRSKIYNNEIHYAFFKLTQNIIHTFKFYYTEVDNLEHLQQEIIIFLLDKIHLYNQPKNVEDKLYKTIVKEFGEEYNTNFEEYVNYAIKIDQSQIKEYISKLDVSDECYEKIKQIRVPKAYSYFGTIVKRWCINYNKDNYKKKINSTPIDDLSTNPTFTYNLEPDVTKDDLSNFMDEFVEYVTENIYDIFPKGNDAKIADSLLELFRNREDLEIFKKTILYQYVREIIPNVKAPKITKISKTLKRIFNKHYAFYLENGYVNFN